MKIQLKKHGNKKTLLLLLPLLVLILIGSYIATAYSFKLYPFNARETSQANGDADEQKTINQVDYSGRSETDENESQAGKENSQNTNTTQGSPVQIAVSFAGVDAGSVEVRAFAANIVEGNGECTVQFKQGNNTIERSTAAFLDATTTQCTPIRIPLSEFGSKGVWTLTVKYTSPNHKGQSEAEDVTI